MAFGDVGFGRAVDMWSLGLVVMDMLGQHAHLQKSDKHPPRYGFLYSAASVFIGQVDVKHFKDHPMPPPPCFSKLRTPVWAPIVTKTLGDNGVGFVSQLLKMNPSKRLSVEGALAHPFMLWDVSTPKSLVPFKGKRHPWNLVTYDLEPNVLEWLRADPVFQPSKFQKAVGGHVRALSQARRLRSSACDGWCTCKLVPHVGLCIRDFGMWGRAEQKYM